MPGRKSNISVVTNGEDASPAPVKHSRESLSVEDLSLPRTMIQRLAKGVLPANTSIQKDASLASSKSATVFVNFIASSSNENATMAGKKTIQPQDVMAASKEHEFDSFLPRLEAESQKYNTVQCDKRNSYRRKVKEEKAAAASTGADAAGGDSTMVDDTLLSTDPLNSPATNGRAGDDEPPSKKVRREPGDEADEDDEDGDDDVEGADGEDDVDVEEGAEEGEEDVEDEDMEEEDEAVDDEADELAEERVPDEMRDEALDEADDSE